jgi:hypothetical protein
MNNGSRPQRSKGPTHPRRQQQSRNRRQIQDIISIPRRIISTRGQSILVEKDLILSSLTGVTNLQVVSNGTDGTMLTALTLSFLPFSTYSGIFNNTDHIAYTGLYDTFRCELVTMTFTPNYTLLSDVLPGTTANNIAECTCVVDFTDTAAPTSYFAIQGYDKSRKVVCSTNKKFSISFVPHVLNLLQLPSGSSSTAQYSVSPFPVMPTASVTSTAGVQVYGIKMAVNPYQTNQVVNTVLMYWTVSCLTRVRYNKQK